MTNPSPGNKGYYHFCYFLCQATDVARRTLNRRTPLLMAGGLIIIIFFRIALKLGRMSLSWLPEDMQLGVASYLPAAYLQKLPYGLNRKVLQKTHPDMYAIIHDIEDKVGKINMDIPSLIESFDNRKSRIIIPSWSADLPYVFSQKPWYLIFEAARLGMTEMVRISLLHPKVDITTIKPSYATRTSLRSITSVVDAGNWDIVRMLLHNTSLYYKETLQYVLERASKHGHIDIVQDLLKDTRVKPASNKNKALENAAAYGHNDIVSILLAQPKVSPVGDRNKPIRRAAKNGHLETVKLLLNYPKVDPSANDNEALRLTAKNGHSDIVQFLLTDARVNPADKNDEALRLAARKGHASVVKLLLMDSRVNPRSENSASLSQAAKKGRIDVVQLLLRDKRADPAVLNSKALRSARKNGHTEVVKLLLEDGRSDPNATKPTFD